MRIEQNLTAAYRQAAESITVPLPADRSTRAKIDRLLEAKPRRSSRLRRRSVQWTIAGSLALLIMGFTAQYFVRIGDDRFSLEVSMNEQLRFDARTASLVRDQLQTVRSQLAVGEKALVYSPEIESLLPDHRSKGIFYAEYVSNPYLFTDYEEWKGRLAGLALPDDGKNGLDFVSGKDEPAYGGSVFESETARRLQAEVTEQGKAVAWEKIEREKERFPAYTTSYRDAGGHELIFSAQVFEEKAKLVGLTQAQQEKIRLSDGREALYAVNDKYLYTDTNFFTSLSWIDTQEGASVLYTVGSSSDAVTKEQLLSIAESAISQEIKEKPAA
ncbi:hypothetical protein [Cohnella cellulosilytica]|uniref:DUF4367 domain-containing protein n=1 Tax=Cohnella cellulosilytica TaxID=986710 RepID=A0ABW2F8Z6_9BACL